MVQSVKVVLSCLSVLRGGLQNYPLLEEIEKCNVDKREEKYNDLFVKHNDEQKNTEKKTFFPINRYQDTEKGFYYGIQTNEPGLKSILRRAEHITDLVLVVSEDVRGRHEYDNTLCFKEIFKETKNIIEDTLRRKKWGEFELSTFEYVIYEIGMTCERTNCNIDNIHLFQVQNELTNEQITDNTISIAQKIEDCWSKGTSKKDNKLFIETNGGLRDFMTILLATIRLVKTKGIEAENIVYANFSPQKRDQIFQIDEKKENYKIFDVVSGVHEYLNYGRVDELLTYYPNNKVLEKLDKLSVAIQYCLPKEMMDSLTEVFGEIVNFRNSEIDAMQRYVINSIADDFFYNELEEENEGNRWIYRFDMQTNKVIDNLIPLIMWCLKKNYIQQAITLYGELMPEYFVEKKLLYYKDENLDGTVKHAVVERANGNCHYSEAYIFIQQFLNLGPGKDGFVKLCSNRNWTNWRAAVRNGVNSVGGKGLWTDYRNSINNIIEILGDYYDIKNGIRNIMNHADNSSLPSDFKKNSNSGEEKKKPIIYFNERLIKISEIFPPVSFVPKKLSSSGKSIMGDVDGKEAQLNINNLSKKAISKVDDILRNKTPLNVVVKSEENGILQVVEI